MPVSLTVTVTGAGAPASLLVRTAGPVRPTDWQAASAALLSASATCRGPEPEGYHSQGLAAESLALAGCACSAVRFLNVLLSSGCMSPGSYH